MLLHLAIRAKRYMPSSDSLEFSIFHHDSETTAYNAVCLKEKNIFCLKSLVKILVDQLVFPLVPINAHCQSTC